MIDLAVTKEQADLDQVMHRLARTARSTGLDLAAGLLEAMREVLAGQAPRPTPRI